MPCNKAKAIALEHFTERFNCAESVLLGVTKACGLQCECVPRVATGFGGGVGGCGEICGALTGAIMALGLKFGRESAEDVEAKTALAAKVCKLMDGFTEKFGTTHCLELTECLMRTPEGREKAKELDLHGGLCRKFVEFAANEASRLIAADNR
jgi:C_GCAxxG_C_C family probable redox protein